MTLFGVTAIVVFVGALGGVINALLSDNGFLKWRWETVDGRRIWRPGAVGNVIFGAAASLVSWGLYGPFSQYVLLPLQEVPEDPRRGFYLTLATIVGAFLVGIGGARALTSELDKRVLSAAAKAATAQADKGASGGYGDRDPRRGPENRRTDAQVR